jgi:N12 class adenine-specific DNA methylase
VEGNGRARDLGGTRDRHGAVEPSDYTVAADDRLGEGGPKAKFHDNINAVRVLYRLRQTRAPATPEEQAILVRYVGWGGLPQAFDHRNEDWRDEYLALSRLLDREDYERARRSTQDAHYTSGVVVQGIYKGLQRLGFEGGRILEPAAGIGHFIGMMPEPMRKGSAVTAIELDPLTSAISQHLYPSAAHLNRGYQDVVIPSGHFDVVVGNPPFGNQSLYDPFHRDLSAFSIHNYFLLKSIDKLRAGGLMAMVVSRYFMDAVDGKARERIGSQAHLLAAIRLPNTAFKRNALTDVTTDILFFCKCHAGELPDTTWTGVAQVRSDETGEPITISRYFCDRPEQMAGRMVVSSNMYRDAAELVATPGEDLTEAIERRLAALPEKVYSAAAAVDPGDGATKPALKLADSLKVGAFFVTPDGRVARRLPDLIGQHDYALVDNKGERTCERIKALVKVRDLLRDLMAAEQSPVTPDAQLVQLRAELNAQYDSFVRKFGHISSQANCIAMAEDPEYPLLQALESEYDKGVSAETARRQGVPVRLPTAKKADIFSKRVMVPRREVQRVESAKDALVVSMNESGRVDLPRMVQLTSATEEQLIGELKGLIFRDPAQQTWRTADEYLTGNVKAKLRAAEAAASVEQRYADNVSALRRVQPADIEAVDIAVQLGSTWVPERVVSDFVGHLLGDVRRRISYQDSLGKWLVKIDRPEQTVATVTWGTQSYPANELIEAILTNSAVQVREAQGTDEHGRPIYRVDDEKTAAANQKADEIRQAFLDWVWEDNTRREDLATIYNERFNTNVPARYDGSHLELPGSSLGIQLRPSQKDGIWRGIQEGNVLYDHVVGAGKTYVLVGVVMESRRMGLINKAMLVVPNHLLLQWKDAFFALYPRANVLVAEKGDFQKENRERLFARIATGSWDAVIVGHSSFKKIGMPEETLVAILGEQVGDLTAAIERLKHDRGDRVTIKEMEKAKERMRAQLSRKADTGAKDRAVTFADLGVDALLVDEAHEFKNLFIHTSLNRVAGLGNLSGSEKAFDLFVKCRYLQERNHGRGVFFATGTPISNTIAEVYTLQRYMQYVELKARGIVHFDAWASTFGRVETGWELDATGANYRLNSRFAKFQNVPELISLYRSFADVVTKGDLDEQARALGTRFPVPRIKGGGPQNIVVERSGYQAQYIGVQMPVPDAHGQPSMRADGSVVKQWNEGSIIWRMENLPKDPRIDNPLKITNDARKAGLDFRLIDPDARDPESSKVNTAVDRVFGLWERWRDQRGTQLVFCDLSTPKSSRSPAPPAPPAAAPGDDPQADDATDEQLVSMDELLAGQSAFSVYDDMRTKLILRGVPASEVRFVHEAANDLQKEKMFRAMNRGEIRILFASTAKAGAGTNVQRRLVAEHHLDVPWRPSDLEQREGRILRQGNLFYERDPGGFEVEILRYATKQSYDSRMWQTIEYKAAGIEQFRRGDMLQRVIEDVAGEAANAAEMKAAATGNPLIFLQVKLNAELKKAEALFANHKRNQYALEKRVAWLASADERAERAAARWRAEIVRRAQHETSELRFRTATSVYGEKDREALMSDVLGSMQSAIERRGCDQSGGQGRVQVGHYRGFDIEVFAGREQLQFAVKGEAIYEPENLRYWVTDKFSVNGFLSRLDNFLQRFETWRDNAEETRRREKDEHGRACAELSKPFSKQQVLDELRADVRDVMAELKLMQANEAYISEWRPRSQREGAAEPGSPDASQRIRAR